MLLYKYMAPLPRLLPSGLHLPGILSDPEGRPDHAHSRADSIDSGTGSGIDSDTDYNTDFDNSHIYLIDSSKIHPL